MTNFQSSRINKGDSRASAAFANQIEKQWHPRIAFAVRQNGYNSPKRETLFDDARLSLANRTILDSYSPTRHTSPESLRTSAIQERCPPIPHTTIAD